MQNKKDRISKILQRLSYNLYERDEVIAVALLSALANQNIFLYGPPGTAKSLISRRLSKVFKTKNYFEYLMQKFSTPEEVFGPISLTELKKDNYVRKTEGYLPTVEFAFLDEIWKSSPAILNTLLTIINEKTFKNGSKIEQVPLKVLISASNETPPKNQGLEALHDRFLTRLLVSPMVERNNFETLLQSGSTNDKIDIDDNLVIKNEELELWRKEINKVQLSQETLNIIHDIRLKIEEKNRKKELDIYVSDRRWQRASILLKAGAFFCDRNETNIVDTLLLSYCLWTTKENREEVIKIVEESVKNSGFETGISIKSLDEEKEALENEINDELYYTSDVYKTVKLGRNKQYFKCTKQYDTNSGYYNSRKEKITFYIPYSAMKTKDEFFPVDENGNELEWIKCQFNKQGVCDIKLNLEGKNDSYYLNKGNYFKSIEPFKPTILFHKGDKKENVNERLVKALRRSVLDLKSKIEEVIKDVEEKEKQFKQELDTPFVPEKKRKIAMQSVYQQLEDLRLRHKDCERLEELVK